MLNDHTCYFLCTDFGDKSCEHGYQKDVLAFTGVCKERGVPCYIEQSRSGNGAHVWVFFDTAIAAIKARRLGKSILSEAMNKDVHLSFKSHDRFFPNQDTLPDGGLGNLVPLPLQGQARRKGNSVFVDENFKPYSDVEQMIEEMRPWYDNYCFAEECLTDGNRVFNCDMVLYYLRHYVSRGQGPKQMLDPNTKTDYSKLKRLIQLDRLDGDRQGVLRKITEEGQIRSELYTSFSAMEMTKPDVFPSLLFYYGMLTIVGTRGSQLILGIPNNNVRKQYYNYLLENYDKACQMRTSKLNSGFTDMAFDGQWRETLQYMAECYKNLSSVRDSIEGERNIQGFFLAYLNLNDYYLTAPEVELQHGYCDFFLLPDLTHYQSSHSYILEIKYLPKKDFSEKSEAQWQEAVSQIQGYARAPKVETLRQDTQLHLIVMQFCGWELARMEEVWHLRGNILLSSCSLTFLREVL